MSEASTTGGESTQTTAQSGTLLSTVQGNQPAPQPSPSQQPSQESQYPDSDWRSKLPEEIRGDQNLKPMLTVEALAKSFIHAQKAIGAEKVPIPGKHATDEDWNKFYQRIGLPDSVEKYEVNVPKESKYVDKETIDSLKPIAHKLGILPKQLEGLVAGYEGRLKEVSEKAVQEFEAEQAQSLSELKKDWGVAFDSRLSFAKKVAEEFAGSPEIFDHVVNNLGNDPKLIRLLGNLGEKLYREGQVPKDGPTGHEGGLYDPATAREKANEIVSDYNHPYHNPEHPKHAAAVREVQQLFAMAHPQPQQG